MAKRSAGIMVYRRSGKLLEILLVHPGGPFWANKDIGAWSIPKGEAKDGEDLLEAAKREFHEETGQPAPEGICIELGSFKRKDGKQVYAWAVEGDFDATHIVSNTLRIEWPPKSGRQLEIPEIDRAAWVPLADAPQKMHSGQDTFVRQLAERLGVVVHEPPQQQALL